MLVTNCYTCHSANTNSKGGLRVDDRNGLLTGGNSGPGRRSRQAGESLLLQAVRTRRATSRCRRRSSSRRSSREL